MHDKLFNDDIDIADFRFDDIETNCYFQCLNFVSFLSVK